MTTIEGAYENGKIKLNEQPPGVKKARVLVTFVEEPQTPLKIGSLREIWKARVPAGFDLEKELRAIRGEWTSEMDDTVRG